MNSIDTNISIGTDRYMCNEIDIEDFSLDSVQKSYYTKHRFSRLHVLT